MHGQIEHEQKFEIIGNKTNLAIDALIELGFIADHIQEQSDVYWDDSSYKITNLKRGLRVRHLAGKMHSVEFKSLFIAGDGTRVAEEVALLVDGSLDLSRLDNLLVKRVGYAAQKLPKATGVDCALRAYGLTPCIVLEKTRQIFLSASRNVEAALDCIAGLPPHIEIELIGDNYNDYSQVLTALKNKLGRNLKPMKAGYLDLITEKNEKLLNRQEFDEMFIKNHAWNVLPAEIKLVERLFAANDK